MTKENVIGSGVLTKLYTNLLYFSANIAEYNDNFNGKTALVLINIIDFSFYLVYLLFFFFLVLRGLQLYQYKKGKLIFIKDVEGNNLEERGE